MYEEGQSVAPDYVEAYRWYALAAEENLNISALANREVLAPWLGA